MDPFANGRAYRHILGLLALAAWCVAIPVTASANPCVDGGAPYPTYLEPGGDEGGIGGTGLRPSTGGIGGTGHTQSDEGGISGTGIETTARVDDEGGISGTGVDGAAPPLGVLGTITGFASICVGGIEVHYDADTPIFVDGEPTVAAALSAGQVVEILARGQGAEVVATEIHARPIVAGPVTAVVDGRLVVAGQQVDVSASTWVEAAALLEADPAIVGTSVRVFGLRRADGSIDASRLAYDASDAVRLRGLVEPMPHGATRIVVSGTPVDLPEAMTFVEGTPLAVRGSWRDGVLVADTVEVGGAPAFLDIVERVDVEGYARALGSALDVGGLVVDVDGPEALAEYAGQRVRLTAEAAGGRWRVRELRLVRPRSALPPRIERVAPLTRNEAGAAMAPVSSSGSSPGLKPPPQQRGTGRGLRHHRPPAGQVRPPAARPPAVRPPGVRSPRGQRPPMPPPRPPQFERPPLPRGTGG